MSSEWIDTTVGKYSPFNYGKGLPQSRRKTGEVPVYGSNGQVDTHNEAYVEHPGIIIGRKGSVGALQLCEKPFWPIDTTFFITKETVEELRFTYYLLKRLRLEKMNSDSAVPGLNRDNAHAIPIRIPAKREDREAIGKITGYFDNKIDLNRQINQTLEQIAQAIFKSWFVDFDPVKAKILAKEQGRDPERAAMESIAGKAISQFTSKDQLAATAALFPDELVESELGLIPKGWECSEIGQEVEVVGGGTPSTKNNDYWENGTFHWTTPKDLSNLSDKVLLHTDRKLTEEGIAKISSGLLPVDTVLMSSRAPVGYLALAKIPTAINQGFIAMKCNKKLTPEYVLQWSNSKMDEIKQRASGSTFAEISKKTFRPISVLIPNEPAIEEFTRFSKSVYNKITESVLESASLSKIRDSLLPRLLSGKIKVQG